MRLDKYLKVARVLKRRVAAKELAEKERLKINDRISKASSEINVGDIITIEFGHRHLQVRVLDIKEHVKNEDSALIYEIVDDQKRELPE